VGKLNLNLYSDDELLLMPIKKLARGRVQSFSREIKAFITKELKARSIHFSPAVWCSTEWFSPDGCAGFAYPFYLLDDRFKQIYLNYFYEIEGKDQIEIKKIIRHECAHALDNAFALRKLKKRQSLFGYSSVIYPTSYSPNLTSNNFIHHLGDCYGASHPDEDWAETFAVWLSEVKPVLKSDAARDKYNYLASVFENTKRFKKPHLKTAFFADNALYEEMTFSEFICYRKKNIREALSIFDEPITLSINKKSLYNLVLKSVISAEKAKIITRNIYDVSEILRKQSGSPISLLSNTLIKQNGFNQVVM